MVPLERNRCFTGREVALRRIRQALTNQGVAGLSQVQAIAGLGGVGKTQTALEYACRYYWDADPTEAYQAVFWIRVDTPQAIQSGFQSIAEILALPQAEAKEPEVITQAVKTWLAEHRGWLLVLDNADDPSFIGPYLPKQGQGHVLITSRVSDLQSLGIVKPLPLDALDPDEALAFLLKRTERQNHTPAENTAATDLCVELGHLPLALEQAAAYIVSTDARFQDYLASYRRRRLELLNQSAPMLGEYRDPVATTWNINFEAVETESPEAADLLRVSAFLHPDSIPYDLIVSGAELLGELIQQALASVETDPLAFVALLAPLKRYSLVRSEVEQTYSVHRLVQAVVRANLEEGEAKLWARRVVLLVTQAYPSASDFNNWPECERLLLHAQAAAATIWQYGFDFEKAGLLLNELGFYFSQRGQYAETEPCYERGLEIYKKALGEAHPDVATSLNNLAGLYQSQGRYSEAEPLYQQALALRKQLLGEAHPHVASSLNNLAALYQSQGRYSEAEPLFQEALALRKQLLGEAHPDVASSLNNLAELYRSQGRYSEAEPLFQETLALWKQLLGEAHPDVASSLNNLAYLYQSQGRYSEAEPLATQALQISVNALGENHPSVGINLGNLASIRVAQGNFEDVEAMFLQALSIFVNTVGSEHPYTTETINRLRNFIAAVVTANQTHLLSNHPTTQDLLAQLQP